MGVKIIIYEDNQHLRNSLQSLLLFQDEIELQAILPNAQTVLQDIEVFSPDVVLMDIDMPVVNGIEALKHIRSQYPELPVLMLTVFEDNDNIFHAICAGASGYLLKKNIDQVVPAVRDVLSGGAPMTGVVARKVLSLFPKPAMPQPADGHSLSARETELLQLLIRGYSYKMIADELQIAIETVRTHIKRIYRKLQVNSATEAIYKATRRGSL